MKWAGEDFRTRCRCDICERKEGRKRVKVLHRKEVSNGLMDGESPVSKLEESLMAHEWPSLVPPCCPVTGWRSLREVWSVVNAVGDPKHP